jgi:hypothetical protein
MTTARLCTAALGSVLLAASLSGCTLIDVLAAGEKEQVFANYTEASATNEPAFAPPEFVPEDAANLRIRTVTDGAGTILSYESDTPPAGDCAAGEVDGSPMLDVGWWPETMPGEGTVCGTWTVFVKGEFTYAFDGG